MNRHAMQPLVTPEDPERFILVARRVEDGRFLFAQWGDWPHPTMISTLAPSEHEGFVEGIESLLHGRKIGRAHV